MPCRKFQGTNSSSFLDIVMSFHLFAEPDYGHVLTSFTGIISRTAEIKRKSHGFRANQTLVSLREKWAWRDPVS
jgi:hypothetical protein